MKTMAAFLVINACIGALQAFAAALMYGFGQIVYVLGAGESWLAWSIAGMLATGSAISVAARLTRGVI